MRQSYIIPCVRVLRLSFYFLFVVYYFVCVLLVRGLEDVYFFRAVRGVEIRVVE